MTEPAGAITEGQYYQKQIAANNRLISWSHRSRFDFALKLLDNPNARVLDYGSGDGTFLAMASPKIRSGVGADISPDQIQDCQARLASSYPNLRFVTTDTLSDPVHTGAYDVVTCMETLEHCTVPNVKIVLSDLARLAAPGGRVIISVPIEIGPTFLLKALIRRHAGRHGLSDYKYYERYSLPNALRMIFATRSTDVPRADPNLSPFGFESYTHYGFNWKRLRERVRSYLTVERTLFTPVGWLGGYFSSQAWFLCRPLPSPR